MVNTNLIEEAIKLASEYYEANGFTVDTKSIKRRVLDWYNHSDIADAELLAAAAIESEYNCAIDYDTIIMWWVYYFPKIPVEYSGDIHVSELIDCY